MSRRELQEGGGRGNELPAVESYQWQWAAWPAEASGRELLAHGFMGRATGDL